MPRSYGFGSNAFGRDYVDLSLLKRVEIVKGSSSALYGSDGLAGHVNFVTSDPLDYLPEGDSLGGRVALQYSGEDQGRAGSATLAGRLGQQWSWLVTGQTYRASELGNAGSNTVASIDRTAPNPQQDRGTSALAKMAFAPTEVQRHVLTLEHVNRDSEYELLSARARQPLVGSAAQIAAAVLDSTSFSEAQRNRATLRSTFDSNAALADEVVLVGSWQLAESREFATEDRNTLADRVRDVAYEEETVQLAFQAAKAWEWGDNRRGALTYGLDWLRTDVFNLNDGVTPPFGETFPLKRFPDTRETTRAAFAQLALDIGRLTLTPAVRYDRFDIDASQRGFSPPATTPAASLADSALTPRLGVLWRARDSLIVYANYAEGFRAPNAGQVNAFFENFLSFYAAIPNPDLRPESSHGGEIGMRWRGERVDLDAAVFGNRFKDFIQDNALVRGAGVPGNPLIFQSINVQQARINGFELRGTARLGQLLGGQWTMPFAYGETRGEDRRTGVALQSIEPPKLVLGLNFYTDRFDARLNATRFFGKRESDTSGPIQVAPAPAPLVPQFLNPAATVVDLSAQMRVGSRARINLAVNNLTNEKYWLWSSVRGLATSLTTIDAYTQPERYVAASLIWNL
jgi:hemoglobin/transferrin/lactoferrin receptor protein